MKSILVALLCVSFFRLNAASKLEEELMGKAWKDQFGNMVKFNPDRHLSGSKSKLHYWVWKVVGEKLILSKTPEVLGWECILKGNRIEDRKTHQLILSMSGKLSGPRQRETISDVGTTQEETKPVSSVGSKILLKYQMIYKQSLEKLKKDWVGQKEQHSHATYKELKQLELRYKNSGKLNQLVALRKLLENNSPADLVKFRSSNLPEVKAALIKFN